ncbi:MAG: hypothetical protein N3E36_00600 [Sulfolobales archaeon]|nr:hypothetical protein [Sulfolobales archaeon]
MYNEELKSFEDALTFLLMSKPASTRESLTPFTKLLSKWLKAGGN